VDPNLAIAVADHESRFRTDVVSSAGAIGVMQLMPATAAGLGVDPRDWQQNVQGGVRLLASLLSQFNGDIAAALGAYDWGASRVKKAMANYGDAWLDHAPAETRAYVPAILATLGYPGPYSPELQTPVTTDAGGSADPGGALPDYGTGVEDANYWPYLGLGIALLFGITIIKS